MQGYDLYESHGATPFCRGIPQMNEFPHSPGTSKHGLMRSATAAPGLSRSSFGKRRNVLALGLAALLCVQPVFAAAQPVWLLETPRTTLPASALPAAVLPATLLPEAAESLELTLLQGEGALNNIRQRTAREPIVEVKDKNHKPVAGALVLFSINETNGAGATIDGATNFRVVTGPDGIARVPNYKPNNTAGQFTITVRATLGMLTTDVIIHQINITGLEVQPKPRHISRLEHLVGHHPYIKVILIGGVVVTGVVVGVVVTRGSAARITVGTGTVTAP
jgi:hypothetical protein